MSSPYCCPECGDGLLFRLDPCPTCASRQRQKQQAAPAGEKRSSYDLTGRVAAAEFWQLLRWYPCCPRCGKPWSKVGLFWRGRRRAFMAEVALGYSTGRMRASNPASARERRACSALARCR
ncbi:putative amidophosphoribosyltransferase [Thermostichus sp. OS-CIW-21]